MTIEIKSKAEVLQRLSACETHLFVESLFDRTPRRLEFEKHLRAVKLARSLIESQP